MSGTSWSIPFSAALAGATAQGLQFRCYWRKAEEGLSLDFEDRRSQNRFPADETLSIRVLRPAHVQVEGQLLDVSEDGMKLVMSQPLEPGTVLQVRSQKRFVLAEVRYCMPNADKFVVGVEVTAVFDLPQSEPL